ncbi:MAG: hypothetical protein M5U15_15395 [Kiritimatiellae bacterium]|nr:hypothetical protein [Kiritimatiellia bacterium]
MRGLILIFASDEGALGKAKTAMTSVVIGGMMIAGGSALYTGSAGSIVSGAAVKAAGFLAAMSFTVGVLMVIVAAVRAIAGFGDDGAYESVKNQLLHAVVGLVIIGASGLITSTFLSVDFTGVIGLVIDRMRILIGTASVLMLAVIIYAAVRMIAGMGDESSFQQMKSTLIYATIGMIITLTAYQLTTFVAGFF